MIKIEQNTYFSSCLDVLDDLKLELSQDCREFTRNCSKNMHAIREISERGKTERRERRREGRRGKVT